MIRGIVGAVIAGTVVAGLWYGFLRPEKITYQAPVQAADAQTEDLTPTVSFLETVPEAVRAVYISQCGAASPRVRKHIENLIETTELNAVVIDVKDYTGTISFIHNNPKLLSGGKGCKIKDLKDWIARLHEKGIYVIGRITVFQDPLYAEHFPEQAVHRRSATTTPWHDYKGLAFIDVGARPFWRYIVTLAKEAHAQGFDELNFDYIRYPSDGPMADAYFSHSGDEEGRVADKSVPLERFFRFLHQELKKPHLGHVPVLSADLFGMTTTNYDDLWIGQIQEKAEPYFDVLAPMVYPSHYPPGFLGLQDPNTDVYRVVHYSMEKAAARVAATTTPIATLQYREPVGTSTPERYRKIAHDPKEKLRPWLQDFDYGGIYDAAKVRAQIQAVYDAGLDSWMLWDPANRYTKEALEPAK